MERKHDIKTLQPKFFEWRSLFGFPTRVMSVNTWGCRKMFVFSMNHLSGQRQEIAAQNNLLSCWLNSLKGHWGSTMVN